jgi:hypothetical protein
MTTNKTNNLGGTFDTNYHVDSHVINVIRSSMYHLKAPHDDIRSCASLDVANKFALSIITTGFNYHNFISAHLQATI